MKAGTDDRHLDAGGWRGQRGLEVWVQQRLGRAQGGPASPAVETTQLRERQKEGQKTQSGLDRMRQEHRKHIPECLGSGGVG